jgi:phenylacetate-CoA ligase
LVVTRLHAHEAPLPRLKLGDRMIRRPDLTGPGLKTRQFEFSGRSGDVIHLGDTQYAAAQVYGSLCGSLKAANAFDLEAVVHDMQFHNNRKTKSLSFVAVVDYPDDLNTRSHYLLGRDGVRRIFIDALIRSLSVFNRGEATYDYLERTGYSFELKFVGKASTEIYRTSVSKVPLLRDIF